MCRNLGQTRRNYNSIIPLRSTAILSRPHRACMEERAYAWIRGAGFSYRSSITDFPVGTEFAVNICIYIYMCICAATSQRAARYDSPYGSDRVRILWTNAVQTSPSPDWTRRSIDQILIGCMFVLPRPHPNAMTTRFISLCFNRLCPAHGYTGGGGVWGEGCNMAALQKTRRTRMRHTRDGRATDSSNRYRI